MSMEGPKPGYKTTEFWVTIVGAGITFAEAIIGVIPQQTGVIIVASLTAIYSVLRTLAKIKG